MGRRQEVSCDVGISPPSACQGAKCNLYKWLWVAPMSNTAPAPGLGWHVWDSNIGILDLWSVADVGKAWLATTWPQEACRLSWVLRVAESSTQVPCAFAAAAARGCCCCGARLVDLGFGTVFTVGNFGDNMITESKRNMCFAFCRPHAGQDSLVQGQAAKRHVPDCCSSAQCIELYDISI